MSKKQFCLSLDQKIIKKLKLVALDRETTPSSIVEELVRGLK